MKPKLSFQPYPGAQSNESYFRIPHRSLALTGITGFHERTISRTSGIQKDRARWRIVATFLRTKPVSLTHPRILSTPGAWWHFERLLEGALNSRRERPIFYCFERDPEIYRLSAVMMACVFHSSGVTVKRDGAVDYVISRKGSKRLINRDVFDYVKRARPPFAAVWLDLTSTITETLKERLSLLRPSLRTDYCLLAITLIRGREQGAVRDQLKAGMTRKRLLEQMVRSACGDDFRIADVFDYADSSPMQQVIFLRGAMLGEVE